MKTKAARFSIDSVVVNGDLIEGKQPKQRASELTLVAPNDQESYTKHVQSGVMVENALVLPVKKQQVRGEWRFVPSDGLAGGSRRVMKCFPVIEEWEGEVCFAVLDETVTKDVLEEFLETAGNFIGLGSFRPENRGIWGRFRLVSLKEAKPSSRAA